MPFLLIVLILLPSLAVTVHAASAPDLTVDSIWLEDASQVGQPISQVSPGQSFNIVATIKNIGQGTAAGYYLDVYYDSDYGRGGPDNIAPGEVQTWYVGPLTAQAGTHTTKWVVDPDNQIAELNESNNQKELAFTVGSQTTNTTTTVTVTTSSSSTSTSTSQTITTTTTSSTTSSTLSSTTSSASASTSSTTQSTSTSTSLPVTHALGWLPENIPKDARVTPVVSAALPTHFDWTQKDGQNWMTTVKNQGGCGSCVAFAAVGALEGQLKIQKNNPSWNIDLSEQHLFSCGGGTCSGGWYISSALNYLQQYGTPDEACSPYQGGSGSCSNSCPDWQSRAFKISSWSWVANNPSAIEAALMNGPLVAGFTVYADFYYGYNGGVYHWDHASQAVGGHAVVIVGYDQPGQYWIVKNSWGISWGENGYFRIGFGEANIEDYVASLHSSLPAPTMYTVSFYTDPVSGNMTADGALKSSGATGAYQSGTRVHVVANPPLGYSFLHWETSGVTVDSTSSANTYMSVSSGGQLKAYFTVGFALNGLTPDNLALAASSSTVLLAARGMENGIWLRNWDDVNGWSGWIRVPGLTDVRPGIAVFNDRLYFLCREAGTSRIWYGWYPLSGGVVSGSFSGWTLLDGPTPVAVSLATDGSYLYLAAEGMDGSIWHRRMDTSGTWTGWIRIPGFTDVSPAISIFQNRLYFACKEAGSNNIWYSYVGLSSYPSGWSGWMLLPGPTPDALTLAASSDRLYVAARGMENGIWYQSMDASGTWTGWRRLAGFTDVAPAIAIFDERPRFVYKQANSNNILAC